MNWVNEWAKFRATDSNGEVFEHENRPRKNEFFWQSGDRTASVYKVSYDRNWENSLEERDMANEEWNDGLPGVGVVCECYTTDVAGMFKWQKGEVLKCLQGECAVMVESALLRWCDQFRPIKKREPQAGEVWKVEANGVPCVFVCGRFVDWTNNLASSDSTDGMVYAAPDVKSYIAREFLKLQEEQERCYVRDIVKEAARLDEE